MYAELVSAPQALLCLVVYIKMSAFLPDRATLVGYKCTNKECGRIFETIRSFNAHKFHRDRKGTMCAHPKCGEIIFQVPVSGVGLQHSRIVRETMFSGERLLDCAMRMVTHV